MELGKFKKIELREVWGSEPRDFTKWLAKKENIALLSDELGLDIEVVQTEAGVGDFSVDILAKETDTDKKVIIENQLESTDHDHLGKLITYAAGYDAVYIIWIVKEVRDEHKRAIDWLNEHTDENIFLFIVKIELWQIENSPIAPKFKIISEANDWAKVIKSSSGKGEFSEVELTQYDYWNKFKEYGQANKTSLPLRKTSPKHWYTISIGNSFAYLSLTLNSRDTLIGCELYIPDSKETYKKLLNSKNEIEKEIGTKLDWQELPERKASRIELTKKSDFYKTEDWNEYFKWMIEWSEKFKLVFTKYL